MSNSENVEIVFPSWGVGFASFLQIRLCQNVLEVYARKLRCMLWSSVEGKRTDSAFGNCCIHLMIEIDVVIFRYDCFCEAKWLIKQCILRFLRAFFHVYLQELYMKGDLPSEIFLHYSPGDVIWIYMGSRPLFIEKMRFFSINQVFGLLFFLFRMLCMYANKNKVQKTRMY